MAKKFYAPLLISGLEDAERGTVQIHVTNDRLHPVTGWISWRLTDAAGKTLADGMGQANISAQANALVQTLDLSEYLAAHGPRDLMLWLALDVDGRTVSTNWVTFARPKHLELRAPKIEAATADLGDGRFRVTLTSDRPALWTWLELAESDARYSDNFVHVAPGKAVEIVVTPAAALTLAEFEAQLQVRSLADTYR
jgi:beta-mannosidase